MLTCLPVSSIFREPCAGKWVLDITRSPPQSVYNLALGEAERIAWHCGKLVSAIGRPRS